MQNAMVIEAAIEWRDYLTGLFEKQLPELIKLAKWPGISDRLTLRGIEFVGKSIPRIQLLIWNEAMADAAIRGAKEAFAETVFDGNYLPAKPQLWMNEDPRGNGLVGYVATAGEESYQEYLGFPKNSVVSGTVMIPSFWTRNDAPERGELPGVFPAYILMDRDDHQKLPIFRFVPPLIQGDTIQAYYNFVANLAWISRPFIELELQSIHRSIRRRLQREPRNTLPLPEIRSVILRKKETKRSNGDTNDQHPIDRDCSWIVRGHWRKQWYPSEKVNKPIYVKPHVKGDVTKPLKPRNEVVYMVKR